MTSKEIALKTIEQLPENVSWEDIQERINFILGVRKGLRELDEGQDFPMKKSDVNPQISPMDADC